MMIKMDNGIIRHMSKRIDKNCNSGFEYRNAQLSENLLNKNLIEVRGLLN
jgi:hypothetical protein